MPMHGQISEPLQMPEPFQTSQQFPLPDSLHIIDMSKTLSNSPPSSGSSMGIIIGGNRNRSGSTPSTPMITATPPTPSPFEQARRSNTHPSFSTPALPGFSRTGSIPPPYPQTPPTSGGEMSGQDYIDYAVSKIGIGKPDQNSLLHRYRTNFDPRPGTFELSSEPEPIEIGSSDHGTIEQPQRQDSGKSFSSSGNVNINANGNGPQHQRGHSSGHGSGHGEIHVKIKRHSATSGTLSRRGLGRSSMRENQYDFLRSFDTVFIIDDSASMEAFTRWSDTRIALETIATIATKYDTDGIDIHFLNSTKHDARNVKSAAEVHRLFDRVQPGGITPIATCLDRILRDYLDSYAAVRTSSPGSPPMTPLSPGFNTAQYPKPLNIIILTDGEPTDDPESVIVDAARRLDMLNAPLHQVGIQFFQIGDEEGAREALEDLDDALAEIYGIRDMVDYTPYPDGQKEGEGREGGGVDGEWILKVLMGAVNRRLDRWENKHGR
ncbi:hypothetical protein DFP73DRAFT_531376 [Morchella snyderi]|nr:hypothetical protein DFP73DRAFT_531376 [Morchella snyderi]